MIIFGIGYVYFVYIDKGAVLSEAQTEIKNSLGRPEHFVITYLPKGSETGSEFIRQEVWYYPSQKQKASFLAGRLTDIAELEIPDSASYEATLLNPEDFDVYTSLKQVESLVGRDKLAPLELPGFHGDGIATYGSLGAVFVFENGYLTYIETFN